MKIRAEIKGKECGQTTEKTNETIACFFKKKISKSDRPLARLSKKEK